jgi:DNA modification methylase
MDELKQKITDEYAVYNNDCIQQMNEIPDNKIHLSGYSLPFFDMYTYSSDIEDLGNCKNYEEFLNHYEYVVKQIHRITKPGRMSAVHCMDIPLNGGQGLDDFPGDIIRLHKKNGFKYWDRKNIWKEPLRVAIRSRAQALKHCQLVTDTSICRGAICDYLLIFKKIGENEIPIEKPTGLTEYDGDLTLMNEIELREYNYLIDKYVNYTDDYTNKLSQFIWRRYASGSWEDIRANRCLSWKEARDAEDERHVCPLPVDIATRLVILYSNPGEIVLSPFAGIGTEIFGAVIKGRKGIGIELKSSYFKQMIKNLDSIKNISKQDELKFYDNEEEILQDISLEN